MLHEFNVGQETRTDIDFFQGRTDVSKFLQSVNNSWVIAVRQGKTEIANHGYGQAVKRALAQMTAELLICSS